MSIIRRSLESFAFALLLLRLTGRKSITQLNYFDFLTVNMVGNLFSNYMTDPSRSPNIFWAPVAVVAADLVADRLAINSRRARHLLEGKPVIFIENGKILEKNIEKMHYNVAEVLAALRYKGIFNLGDVEFAVLEIDGTISVLKKSQKRPLTPKDLNIPTQYEGLSYVIISNGKILWENLQKNNLGQGWLENKLKEQGIHDISRVYLASLATDGSLYVDLKDGYPETVPGTRKRRG
ncbi:MAG TPA: DUF421 domain-containing protein [Clostridia bacterium]|nr:DUF421 domain-containing protein [Clostridia bacterium]